MPRTHAPVRALPEDDWLLTFAKAARRLDMHKKNFAAYAARWPLLSQGIRVTRTRPGTRGIAKVLRSALVEHMHVELVVGAEQPPVRIVREAATS